MAKSTAVAVPVDNSPAHLIEMAIAKGADPANLERLMDLQERWEAKQAKQAFDDAFAKFQSDCPPIVKQKEVNLGGGGYSYAGYEDIMHIIRVPLAECGLALSFDSEWLEGGLLKTTCIVSGHGHERTTSVTLPVPSEMRVNATQKAGAGLSYGKRYAVINALNLVVVGEDSDAARLYDSQNLIDEAQVDTLTEMLSAAESNIPGTHSRFMGWMEKATGAAEIAALPSKQYGMVHEMLRGKLKAGGL